MRIENLSLKNIRIIGADFPEIDFSPAKNATIFLGDNGSGKTTVLDSIAFLLNTFIAQFPGNKYKQFLDEDVHVNNEGLLSPYLKIQANFKTTEGESVFESRTKKGLDNAPESDLKAIKQLADKLKKEIVEGYDDVRLPVFAYYGTGRGQIKAPERRRNFQKVFERWDCYANALIPSADFKSFFAWFDLMEDEERRERENLRDFDYKLPVLETVRRAIESFVDQKYHSPRIELHPLRFVMTEGIGNFSRSLRIEQMSDGYKIIIAMVADIASRMAEANPAMENPLESSGIVLIDEIDLHLHPKWQRVVVHQLLKTFPNVQFILTTHSPVIITGAASEAQVIHLDIKNSYDDIEVIQNLETMDVGQILLSDMFGLKSLQSPVWDKKIQWRDKLLSKAELSTEEQKELDFLNDELSVLQNGDTPNEILATKLLKAIASNLNIKI